MEGGGSMGRTTCRRSQTSKVDICGEEIGEDLEGSYKSYNCGEKEWKNISVVKWRAGRPQTVLVSNLLIQRGTL